MKTKNKLDNIELVKKRQIEIVEISKSLISKLNVDVNVLNNDIIKNIIIKSANNINISTFEEAIDIYNEVDKINEKQKQILATKKLLNDTFNKLDMKWKKWKQEADLKLKYEKGDVDDTMKLKLDIELFTFCDNNTQNKLVLNNYDNKQRKYIHQRCDQLKLKHESSGNKKNRILELTKNKNWKFSKPKNIDNV